VHAFKVSAFLSHYELHITTPFTDALLSINDLSSFCHASIVARFSSATDAKLVAEE